MYPTQDEEEGASCNFVNGACWVQGLYVYKQLIDKVNTGVAYYGIPKNIDQEGYMQGALFFCYQTFRSNRNFLESFRPNLSLYILIKNIYKTKSVWKKSGTWTARESMDQDFLLFSFISLLSKSTSITTKIDTHHKFKN